jgi:8-oxo-dGTP pyrophosphatase MutT (NUDIX family)
MDVERTPVLTSVLTSPPKKRPIISYGIILFCMHDETPHFLLYQRRDNYEYVDIIRGNWHNEPRLRTLFSCLSKEEHKRIRTHTFDELWDDLWIHHGSPLHVDGYKKAKKKYESKTMKIVLNDLDVYDKEFHSLPWGFPKGRKNMNGIERESDESCALREFREETNIKTSDIYFWKNTRNDKISFYENYRGNDGKNYSTRYFLAETSSMKEISRIETPKCIRKDAVSHEAEDVKWMCYIDAFKNLSPERQNILKEVFNLIKNKYKYFSPYRDS